MEALAVDLRLLQTVLVQDLKVSLGRELMARVAAVNPTTGRGTISLAGVLLDAELPKTLQAGQEIRLQVREVTPEKVVLGLQENPTQAAAPPPAAPLPGGGTVQVTQRDGGSRHGGGSAGGGVHSLALRYDAPALGPVDMHFVLAANALRLQVTTSAGAAHEAADDASDQLVRALTEALGLPVSVSVGSRYEPLDLYA